MRKCEGCGIEFQPRNSRHRFHSTDCRIQHQWGRRNFGPNRKALERQIQAMATGPEHSAHIEACRHLADVVDALTQENRFSEKAWREYRLALDALREAVKDAGGGPKSFEQLVSELRAEIPDPSDA
ncbi:MAG TPA: hypothetical protein VF377_10560 [Acidimicrobiia bacterium]